MAISKLDLNVCLESFSKAVNSGNNDRIAEVAILLVPMLISELKLIEVCEEQQ